MKVVQDSKTVVRCAVVKDELKVGVGLHQGLALSPFLLAVVMADEARQDYDAYRKAYKDQRLSASMSVNTWDQPSKAKREGTMEVKERVEAGWSG